MPVNTQHQNQNGGQEEVRGGRLAAFLQDQKEAFLSDLSTGNARGWTVVMGNEAGDLDSLASSIAYAQLSSSLRASRTVPLALTPSSYMSLRPENLLAFNLTNIPLSALLHPEQLPIPTLELGSKGVEFALVDHNKLLPSFNGPVNSVIDHHEDEGCHLDASIREITVGTGSCTSLVVGQFMKEWKAAISSPAGLKASPVPPEVATLLLSGILIDTGALKKGGKATEIDYQSASFLYPLSTLAQEQVNGNGYNTSLAVDIASTGTGADLSSQVPQTLQETAKELLETKMDVSKLSTYDLLLRDYKEYNLPTSSVIYPSLRVGLSTVPLGLKKWLAKENPSSTWDGLLRGVDGYMKERNLDIEGILTTFTSEKGGKHRRELVLIVRQGGAISSIEQVEKILEEIQVGLEESGPLLLDLTIWDKLGQGSDGEEFTSTTGDEGRMGRAWKQGNARSTRKQLAPLLRDVIAKIQ